MRRLLLALSALFVFGCATTGVDIPAKPGTPAVLAVITWNMDAGRGDLSRLTADLSSGRLTGASPADYVLLLQEYTSGIGVDAEELARERNLHAFIVPVYEIDGHVRGNAIVSITARMPSVLTRAASAARFFLPSSESAPGRVLHRMSARARAR